MKIVTLLLLTALPCAGQQLHFEIPAHAIAHPVAAVKAATTSSNTLHRVTFWVSVGGAVASLLIDGGSTEYVNAHDTRFYPGVGWQQVSFETNTFFTTNGQISQAKLWASKTGLAALPFLASWLVHDFAPQDSKVVDITDIAVVSGLSAWYTEAGIRNWNQAQANIAWNRSVGKP